MVTLYRIEPHSHVNIYSWLVRDNKGCIEVSLRINIDFFTFFHCAWINNDEILVRGQRFD